ncbi:MAG: S16 family serine protease, partial [Oscillibacter sp.]
TVIIPKDNLRDLEEIDQTVRAALHFIPVATVDEVFAAALGERSIHEERTAAAFAPVLRETDAALRQ